MADGQRLVVERVLHLTLPAERIDDWRNMVRNRARNEMAAMTLRERLTGWEDESWYSDVTGPNREHDMVTYRYAVHAEIDDNPPPAPAPGTGLILPGGMT